MAIYEFRTTILSSKEFNEKFKSFLPLFMRVYSNGRELDIDCGYDTEYEYWDNKSLDRLENRLKKEFTNRDEHWSEKCIYYGYDKSIRFSVWNEHEDKEVDMAIDVRNIDYVFLKKILDILFELDTVIVIEDTGYVISSDYNTFVNTMHASERYKRFGARIYDD